MTLQVARVIGLSGSTNPDWSVGEQIALRSDCIAFMTTVRKALGHLPTDLQYRLLQIIVARVEREELGSLLKRVSARPGGAGLELEFSFQGCSDTEAMRYASAALRDAAASITEAL